MNNKIEIELDDSILFMFNDEPREGVIESIIKEDDKFFVEVASGNRIIRISREDIIDVYKWGTNNGNKRTN